jgi:hypothetical protein
MELETGRHSSVVAGTGVRGAARAEVTAEDRIKPAQRATAYSLLIAWRWSVRD